MEGYTILGLQHWCSLRHCLYIHTNKTLLKEVANKCQDWTTLHCDGNPVTKLHPGHVTQALSNLCYYLEHSQDNLIKTLQYLKRTYKKERDYLPGLGVTGTGGMASN